MTNLGAGFPVGSPESTGPPPSSSSGPPSERDRYRELFSGFFWLFLQSSKGVRPVSTPPLLVVPSAIPLQPIEKKMTLNASVNTKLWYTCRKQVWEPPIKM